MEAYKKLGKEDSEEDNKWVKSASKEGVDVIVQERKAGSLEKQSREKPLRPIQYIMSNSGSHQ